MRDHKEGRRKWERDQEGHTTAYLQRPTVKIKKELEFKRTWRKQINPSKNISDRGVVKHASSCSLGQLLLTIIIEATRDPFLLKPSLNIPPRFTQSHFKYTYFRCPSHATKCLLFMLKPDDPCLGVRKGLPLPVP